MYIIEKITDKKGNEKTDKHSKERIGCKGYIGFLYNYTPMTFVYAEDKDGNVKENMMVTSSVEDYDEDDKYVTVYTLNSVYWLRKCN